MNKVAILLSTFNGEKYLKDQIDSLFNQRYKNSEVIVRDDLSSDNTLEIIKLYDIKLLKTKQNLGPKKSFIELLKYAMENSSANYFMFCDQDDIWEKDKVEKTLDKIQKMELEFGDIPLLVHTNLEVVDEKLFIINKSFMNFQKIDSSKNKFNNLLMQNIITGCTVMINRKLAEKCLYIPDDSIMHDWWIGLIASKFGQIGYINETMIKYRQHTSNTIGAKGFSYKEIIKKGFDFSYKIKIDKNITQANAFLEQFHSELDNETIKMLQEFSSLKQKKWWQRRLVILKYRLLKQGFSRNLGLLLKI
jgi:glycosyltransferase involved in cell wall biosynthesis